MRILSIPVLLSCSLLMSACATKQDEQVEETVEQPTVEQQPLISHVVKFEFDSYKVPTEIYDIITPHADYLVRYPTRKVLIEGGADERGDEQYNFQLGLRRAHAVKEAFINAGVDESQLIIRSIGSERPVNARGEHAKNRRVVLVY